MKTLSNINLKCNPWIPSNAAQREWIAKWKHEQTVCQECNKQEKCTMADRQNKSICQLLREKS